MALEPMASWKHVPFSCGSQLASRAGCIAMSSANISSNASTLRSFDFNNWVIKSFSRTAGSSFKQSKRSYGDLRGVSAAPKSRDEHATADSMLPGSAERSRKNVRKKKPPVPRYIEGIATVGTELELSKEIMESWKSDVALDKLDPGTANDPVGHFIAVPPKLVPEAEASFYHDASLPNKVNQRHLGCKGMTEHFDAFNERSFLYRESIGRVFANIRGLSVEKEVSIRANPNIINRSDDNLVELSNVRRFWLEGWSGSGKSCSLYALVCWMRAKGWIVMYIPSASIMVSGGRYYRRGSMEDEDSEGNDEKPVWDTPEAARHIMRAILESHKDALSHIHRMNGEESLLQVAERGLDENSSAQTAVEAAIALKDGLLYHDGSKYNTMVVIDDYNMLYDKTEYLEPMHAFYNRPILPSELSLASSYRVLESSSSKVGVGVVVASPKRGGSVSPSVRVPMDSSTSIMRIPRFNLHEAYVFGAMLKSTKIIFDNPAKEVVTKALSLTNGNGKELREMAQALFSGDDIFGLSLGYKIIMNEKKKARSQWKEHMLTD